jgi:hypothetical protein
MRRREFIAALGGAAVLQRNVRGSIPISKGIFTRARDSIMLNAWGR